MFKKIIGFVIGLLRISEPKLVNGASRYGGGNIKFLPLFHSNQAGIWLRPEYQQRVTQAPPFTAAQLQPHPSPQCRPLFQPKPLVFNPIYFLYLDINFPRLPYFKPRPDLDQVPSPYYPAIFPSWHPLTLPCHQEKSQNKQGNLFIASCNHSPLL